MSKEYVSRSELIEWLCRKFDTSERCAEKSRKIGDRTAVIHEEDCSVYREMLEKILSMDSFVIDGDTSDGEYTFNELYFQRTVLLSVIASLFQEISWKVKLDDEIFMVGINTPLGQAACDCDLTHWDIFKCPELKKVPQDYHPYSGTDEWRRIASLSGYSDLMSSRRKQNETV